jgi:virginiamycin B lyase
MADARVGHQAAGTQGVAGKISQWPVPTPKSARDPAVDAQGNVYFAVARGDRIARFDPKTEQFTEWKVPEGTGPQAVVVTADNKVFFGGHGNGTIGELDPRTGSVRALPTSGRTSGVYALAGDSQGNIWYTERDAGKIGMLDRATGTMSHWTMDGEPYALVQARNGHIWVTRIAADKVSVLDPRTGEIADVFTGAGSKPRRIAVAPDGLVWVTLYGSGKLVVIDPASRSIRKEYELPGWAVPSNRRSVVSSRPVPEIGRPGTNSIRTDAPA